MKLTTKAEFYAYQEGYKEASRYFEKELREIKKWGDGDKYYEPEVSDALEGVIDVATDYARKGPDSMQTELTFEEED